MPNACLQAHLLMEVEFPKHPRHSPAELISKAHDTWTATAHKVRISQLHKEVSQQLTAMGIAHTLEQLTSGDLFSIDLAIPGEHMCHHCEPYQTGSNTYLLFFVAEQCPYVADVVMVVK